MNQFSDFGIKPETKGFIGEKVKMERILNRDIIVHDYRIEKSKVNEGKCLHLQIELNKEMRIVFTGAGSLIEVIQKISKGQFPFKTQIIKENERFQFS